MLMNRVPNEFHIKKVHYLTSFHNSIGKLNLGNFLCNGLFFLWLCDSQEKTV